MDKSLDEVIKESKQEGKNQLKKQRRPQQQKSSRGGQGRRFGTNQRIQQRNNFVFKRTGPRPAAVNQAQPRLQIIKPAQEGKGKVLKIFNLSPDINEQELYNLVTQYGAVEECKIIRDAKGKSQEQAVVVFRDHESADDAKKDLHRNELEGRCISVEIYKKSDVDPQVSQNNQPERETQERVVQRQRRGLFQSTQQSRQGRQFGRGGQGGSFGGRGRQNNFNRGPKPFKRRGGQVPW